MSAEKLGDATVVRRRGTLLYDQVIRAIVIVKLPEE
jgi:hypothetical protein